MCLSFPGRVVAIDELGAAVEMEGRLRRALTTFAPETEVGDWVLVSAGSIVQRLDPGEATFVCDALREARRGVLADALAVDDAEAAASS